MATLSAPWSPVTTVTTLFLAYGEKRSSPVQIRSVMEGNAW